MGIHASFLRKKLQPLRGCGEGWGPAVRPQRLLRTFSMPVALLCVESEQSPKEITLGSTEQSHLHQLPIPAPVAPYLTALYLECPPRRGSHRGCGCQPWTPLSLTAPVFYSLKYCLSSEWDRGLCLHLGVSVCGVWASGGRRVVGPHKPECLPLQRYFFFFFY